MFPSAQLVLATLWLAPSFATSSLSVPVPPLRRSFTPTPQEPTGVDKLRAEADALEPVAESPLGHAFLAAARELPTIESGRALWYSRATRAAYTLDEAAALDEAALEGFDRVDVSERLYYETFYGSPLGYLRAFDALGANGMPSVDGRRILDFGYGGIGHLRSLASLGAEVVGVEVNDLLRALYSEPGDTGEVARTAVAGEGEPGHLRLLHGSFPGDDALRAAVGDGFDCVLSKNVLKKGYIHPEREADPRMLIDLGVDDATFLGAVHDALKPGGLFLIYNLYPKQAAPDEPYIPWATGECPFEREAVRAAGFEVVAWNWNDTAGAHRMARALGWDQSESMADLESSLFGMLTLLRRVTP